MEPLSPKQELASSLAKLAATHALLKAEMFERFATYEEQERQDFLSEVAFLFRRAASAKRSIAEFLETAPNASPDAMRLIRSEIGSHGRRIRFPVDYNRGSAIYEAKRTLGLPVSVPLFLLGRLPDPIIAGLRVAEQSVSRFGFLVIVGVVAFVVVALSCNGGSRPLTVTLAESDGKSWTYTCGAFVPQLKGDDGLVALAEESAAAITAADIDVMDLLALRPCKNDYRRCEELLVEMKCRKAGYVAGSKAASCTARWEAVE